MIKGTIAWNKGLTKETHPGVARSAAAKVGKMRSAETRQKISLGKIGRKYPGRVGISGPRTSVSINCLVCKKQFLTYLSHFKKGRKCCSVFCAKTIRISKNKERSGEHHYRWIKERNEVKIGDRTLHDPLSKQWRKQVIGRDNWSCRIADNNCDGRLEAHHILRWVDSPDLRYDINNGITLCHAHHPRKRAEEKRLAPLFQRLVSVSIV
mgnify:CR=1 FL=1